MKTTKINIRIRLIRQSATHSPLQQISISTHKEYKKRLRANNNSAFAVKLAYLIRYNTDPPAFTDDTDTQFTTNLVYSF